MGLIDESLIDPAGSSHPAAGRIPRARYSSAETMRAPELLSATLAAAAAASPMTLYVPPSRGSDAHAGPALFSLHAAGPCPCLAQTSAP